MASENTRHLPFLRQPTQNPIVAYFPHQAHCYAFGGFEIQMLDVARACRAAGIRIELQDYWSKESQANIVHHWGHGYSHLDNIRWAKRASQLVVVTALLGYYCSFLTRMRARISRHLRLQRLNQLSFQLADKVVVVNELQADALSLRHAIPKSRIEVIPHAVAKRISDLRSKLHLGSGDYWVLPGNVCRRKNQLNAVKAAIKAGLRLIIIGNTLSGEEDYGAEVQQLSATSSLVSYVPGMDRDSDAYLRLLCDARGLLLPSLAEQQPIVALEMAFLGKPIILANRPYAFQRAFSGAALVDPLDINSLSLGLKQLTTNPSLGMLQTDLSQFTEESVALAYKHVYCGLLRDRTRP